MEGRASFLALLSFFFIVLLIFILGVMQPAASQDCGIHRLCRDSNCLHTELCHYNSTGNRYGG